MNLLDARLDLYKGCNYKCVYCGGYDAGTAPVSFSLHAMDGIFPLLNRYCWSVYLSCDGEPTLHPHFAEAMQKVRKHLPRPDVSMVTNGFRLTDDKIDHLLNAGLSRIYVSIDTLDPEKYQRLCQCGHEGLNIVTNNVKTLIARRGRNPFPKVIVTAIAMKSTLDGLEDMADWVIESKIDALNVQWLLTQYNPAMKDEAIGLDAETLPVLKKIGRQLTRNGVHFDYPYTVSTDKAFSVFRGTRLVKNKGGYLLFNLRKLLKARKRGSCRIAGNTFMVNPDGTLQFCENSAVEMPNILTQPAVNLGKIFRDAQNKLAGASPENVCKSCVYFGQR